jgi:type VI protein secretion system component VasF
MNDLTNEAVSLDEQVWRELVYKEKLRAQSRDRRRRKVAGIVVILTAVAFVIFYVSTKT